MALDGEELGQAIIEEINTKKDRQGAISAVDAVGAMGKAIAKYLQQNTEIEYSWQGIDNNSVKDPLTSFKAKITSISIMLQPSQRNKRAAALSMIASTIQSSVIAAIIAPNDATFQLPLLQFLPASPPLVLDPKGDSQQQAMTGLGTNIVDWIKVLTNPAPISGMRTPLTPPPPGPFIGTATMTSIE